MRTHRCALVLATLAASCFVTLAADGDPVSPGGTPAGAAPQQSQAGRPLAAPATRDSALRTPARDSVAVWKKLTENHEYDQAEARARAFLASMQSGSGTDSLEIARVSDWLVDFLMRSGRSEDSDARALAERSVRINETVLGQGSAELGTSLYHLGMVLYVIGDYQAALTAEQRSLAVREKAPGPDHRSVAESLNGIGNVLLAFNRYAEARPLYERAIRIWEKDEGPGNADIASPIENLAIIFDVTGNWSAARPLYERALSIIEEAVGTKAAEMGKVLGNYAGMLADGGDYETARSLYERALKIIGDRPHPNPDGVAWASDNLAGVLLAIGDTAAARPLYERAMALEDKSLAAGENASVAEMSSNYANLLRIEGDYAGAKQRLERALAIEQKAYGRDDPALAGTLKRMAEVTCDSGDYAGARPYAERALALEEKGFGADQTGTAGMLGTLSLVLANLAESRAALDSSLRAEAIGRSHLSLTARSLPERQALRYSAVREGGLGLALSLAAGSLAGDSAASWRVCDALIRSRALVLDEMAARHQRLDAAPETVRRSGAFAAARQRLANLWVRGPRDASPQEYQALLDSARRESEAAEQALAEISTTFREERNRSQLGLSDVASALAHDDALVGFVHFDRFQTAGAPGSAPRRVPRSVPWYVAFVLRGDVRRPILVSLGSAAEIDSLTARWSEQAQNGGLTSGRGAQLTERLYRDAGDALRRAVWDPLAAHMENARRVFVVPDGALNQVSFAALPVGKSEYLIERGPLLHYLSAERDLVTSEAPPSHGGLLAVGGADFDAAPAASGGLLAVAGTGSSAPVYRGERAACGDFRSLRFIPLPATALEVSEVSALWKKHAGEGTVIELTGARATKAAFEAAAPRQRVLHLATHGFFLGRHCPSALGTRGIGGMSASGGGATPPVVGDNPLLLSGLALAGANNRESAGAGGDDGILTAEEIAALDLSGTEWAVLSACETGVGEVRTGEGVFGLRRAFQVAGARTLIMSLWAVEDASARHWMRSLYEGATRARREHGGSRARGESRAAAGTAGQGREHAPVLLGGLRRRRRLEIVRPRLT